MRFQIILGLGLIGLACAVPLVDKKASSLKVIDIPADLFAEASENVETEKKPEEPVVTPDVVASESVSDKDAPAVKVEESDPPPNVEITEPKGDDDKTDGVTTDKTGKDEERPNFFGFRLPTVVILRRPAIFDDPFSSFPFFSSPFAERRPFFGLPASRPDQREAEEDAEKQTPLNNAAASPSEQRPVSVGANNGGIADIMHGVRQQMDSLFSTLFAPNQGIFNSRPLFPRPFFPAGPVDSSSTEDDVDFDKLPNNYKNSTSETKIVDGQVVEVNRTVHKISGNNSNGFFQFSIIKVRPSDAPKPVTEEKPAESSDVPAAVAAEEKRESTTIKAQQEAEMNNPSLNEVFDKDEKEPIANTKYETDPGLLPEQSKNAPVAMPLTEEIIYDFVPLETEEKASKSIPHELSSDLRVNNLMEKVDSARLRSLVDPDDVEVIAV